MVSAIPNATTDHRVSRPGGVDTGAGGTAGGTCSSPGGRSRVAVGQQRDEQITQIPDNEQHYNWNNLMPFETPAKSKGDSDLDFSAERRQTSGPFITVSDRHGTSSHKMNQLTKNSALASSMSRSEWQNHLTNQTGCHEANHLILDIPWRMVWVRHALKASTPIRYLVGPYHVSISGIPRWFEGN